MKGAKCLKDARYLCKREERAFTGLGPLVEKAVIPVDSS